MFFTRRNGWNYYYSVISYFRNAEVLGYNKFVRDIVSLKEVVECYNISGDYDFLLKIVIRDMKHYQFFVINELGSVENIGNAHSTFVIGVTKHSYSVPL